jgi:hypothetical protein
MRDKSAIGCILFHKCVSLAAQQQQHSKSPMAAKLRRWK